jgi:hypothetical protein
MLTAYDMVALLCDSYVELPLSLQTTMLARYCERVGMAQHARASFVEGFWRVAVQRKLKDAGRFVFIDQARSNPDFLRWYPRSLRYVGRALAQLGDYDELNGVLHRLVPGFPDSVSVPIAQTGAHAGAKLR